MTLGILFVLVITFVPGGIMEGINRFLALLNRRRGSGGQSGKSAATADAPASAAE